MTAPTRERRPADGAAVPDENAVAGTPEDSPGGSSVDTGSPLEVALRWASVGVPVFPIQVNRTATGKVTKTPLTPRGHKDATDAPLAVKQMFAEAKVAPGHELAVGAVPGRAGYLVVDIDTKGGVDGYATAAELGVPDTFTVTTPSGGEHRWFHRPTGEHVGNLSAPGIDIRCDAGWVVAPGTQTSVGSWSTVQDLADVVMLPADVFGKLQRPRATTTADTPHPYDEFRISENPTKPVNAIVGEYFMEREGGRHPAALKAITALRRLHTLGYPGIAAASEQIRADFMALVTGDGSRTQQQATTEWTELVKAAANHVASTPATAPEYQPPLQQIREAMALGGGDNATHDAFVEIYAEKFRAELRRGRAILDLPPVTYMVPGWIPNSSVGMLYAPAGAGKSFVAFTLAVEIARGGRWDGHQLEPGTVLYIGAEAPSVLRDRVADWEQYYEEHLPDSFHWITAKPQLADLNQLEALQRVVAEVKPRFLVVDTLALCTEGVNENDGREWGRIGAALDTLARASQRDTENGTEWASILAVHHTGKDATKEDRGSSVMKAKIDYRLKVTGDVSQLCLVNDREKSGPGGRSLYFKLELVERPTPDGKLTPGALQSTKGAVLVPVGYAEIAKDREDAVLEVLALPEYLDSGAALKDIAEICEVSSRTMARWLAKLAERGSVELLGSNSRRRYRLPAEHRLTAMVQVQEDIDVGLW